MHIYLGHDMRERRAFNVAISSIAHTTPAWPAVHALDMVGLRDSGLYTRPTNTRSKGGVVSYYDQISDAPMSTGHAIARFFVPLLMDYDGWAMFVDSDVVVRRNLQDLWRHADDKYAVMCVQHDPEKQGGVNQDALKKGGHLQQFYARKNWSSVMLLNCSHYANLELRLENVNKHTGRYLHGFGWLEDEMIGALPPEWNYLVGIDDMPLQDIAIAHFTLGTPDIVDDIQGAQATSLAQEWWDYAQGYSRSGELKGIKTVPVRRPA